MSTHGNPARAGGAAGAPNFLYVVTGKASNKPTLHLLRWIVEVFPYFRKMGVRLSVVPISQKHLANRRLREQLKKKGITSLPALVTAKKTYTGAREIKALYQLWIQKYISWEKKVANPNDEVEDSVEKFYRDEMSMTKAKEEDQNVEGDPMMQTNNMMDQYRTGVTRRAGQAPPEEDLISRAESVQTRRSGRAGVPPDVSGGMHREANVDSPAPRLSGGLDFDKGNTTTDDELMMKHMENQGIDLY